MSLKVPSNGIRFVGVAPEATLLSYKVFGALVCCIITPIVSIHLTNIGRMELTKIPSSKPS